MSRTPRRTPAQAEDSLLSPTRATRLEEKSQLQDLNNRLEVYILQIKERDNARAQLQEKLDSIIEEHADELQNRENYWNSQLNELRKARDAEGAARARLDAEVKNLRKDHDYLQQQLNNARASQERLKASNDEMNHKLHETMAAHSSLKEDHEHATSELEIVRSELNQRTKDFEELRDSAAKDDEETADLTQQLEQLQAEADGARTKAQSEIQRLQKALQDANRANIEMQDSVREQLSRELTTIMQKAQLQYAKERDSALEDLRDQYEEKLKAYREHLERAGHELEELRDRQKQVQEETRKTAAIREEFEMIKTTLETRVKELEESVQEEKTKPNRTIKEKNEIIRKLKAAFKRKDAELGELIDVKLALALEIKKYRELLEQEEERLGYLSPAPDDKGGKRSGKKRKTREDSSAIEEKASARTSVLSSLEKGTLVFNGMALNGDYVKIKNGSVEDVNLGGWKLQTNAFSHVFEFPDDITLRPGQTVEVWTTADAEENPPGKLVWSVEDDAAMWDNTEGDVIDLIDPEGDVIASVEVYAEDPVASPEKSVPSAAPMAEEAEEEEEEEEQAEGEEEADDGAADMEEDQDAGAASAADGQQQSGQNQNCIVM